MNIQIIIAGVGGQGVLFASRVLQETALFKGFDIIGSETHGMSQRGGSVVSHLKICKASSPLIRRGATDILYSFQETETYRNLTFLKKDGVAFVNTSNNNFLQKDIKDYLKKNGIQVFTFDADKIAMKLNSPLSSNLTMLGFSLSFGYLPFNKTDIKKTIKKISKKQFQEVNLKAFEAGYSAGKN